MPTAVSNWRTRFAEDGLAGIGKVRPGRAAKCSVTDDQVADIVPTTLNETPPGQTHWSCRSMAEAKGVSPASVQRIWSGLGIKPHLTKTFKISDDPQLEAKLVDAVGLYMDPPDKAIVLCDDEKSQMQALDRTQPMLPVRPGMPARGTHD